MKIHTAFRNSAEILAHHSNRRGYPYILVRVRNTFHNIVGILYYVRGRKNETDREPTEDRQYIPMVREKISVVRGEIWTLFAMFMFIILLHYILIRLSVADTGSLTIFALLRCSNKYHTNNFVIIKRVHFILIKWNSYDHYFIMFVHLKKNSCWWSAGFKIVS
jgi:hypothetical protein